MIYFASIQIIMRQNKEEDHQLNLQLRALMQDLKCVNQNPIQRICNNPHCLQPALHCSNIDCEHCHLAHENCGSYLFQKFTREVQKKTAGTLSQFYQKMAQIESHFVEKIHRSKKKFLYAFSIDRLTNILDRKYYHMIDSIYRSKNSEAITGQQAHELFQKLTQPQIQKGCRESWLLQIFEDKTHKILKEYLSMREWIFDSLHGQYRNIPQLKQKQKKQVPRITIDSNALAAYRNSLKLEDLMNYPNQKVQMFSNIIYEEIQKLDNQFIFAQLNKPSSLQLSFRASKHNFSAKEFHHLCDGIEGTLILAINQYDKVIGGFTPLSWFGENFKGDPTSETILLGINQKVKMSLSNPSKAIFCDRNMGPTFGGQAFILNMMHSYDFSISDGCNNNKKSSMHFPKSFRFKGRPVETQQICGLKNGGSFTIREYEVYKVVYNQKKH